MSDPRRQTLDPLQTAELSRMVQLGRFHRVPRGATVVSEGAPLDGLYLVFRGQVLVRPARRAAARRAQKTLGSAEVFGQTTPGVPEPSPYQVTALEDTALIHLDSASLSQLFASDLALGSRLLGRLRGLLQEVEQAAAEGEQLGKLLAVYGPRGGAGATSAAVLAAGLAGSLEVRTLVLDLHPWFGEVAPLCEWRPRATLADLLHPELAAEELEEAAATGRGFDVVAAPRRLEDGEELAREHLGGLLDLAVQEYDLVIADLPESLSELVLEVLDRADRILMTLTADFEGILAGRKAAAFLEQLGAPVEGMQFLLNRFRGAGGLTPTQLRDTLKRPARVVAEDRGQLLRLANDGHLWKAPEALPEHPLVQAVEGVVREALGLQAPVGGPSPELYQEEPTFLPISEEPGAASPEAGRGGWVRWIWSVAALALLGLAL